MLIVNEQLSFEEAKRLSLIKWKLTLKYFGKFSHWRLEGHRELACLNAYCGFCERWRQASNDCNSCEFGKIAGQCNRTDENLFEKWSQSKNCFRRMYYAIRIYSVIKNLKEN